MEKTQIVRAAALCALLIAFCAPASIQAQNWQAVEKGLLRDFGGKIVSIEKLDSATCWARIDGNISHVKAVDLAESIGYYIRNTTGGIKGKTPSVHIFKGSRHIAVARPSGVKYTGKLQVQEW